LFVLLILVELMNLTVEAFFPLVYIIFVEFFYTYKCPSLFVALIILKTFHDLLHLIMEYVEHIPFQTS
jgi:hypothetical protein